MRIVFYVPTIAVDADKADSIHVRELAENLSGLGNKVTVICRLRNPVYGGLAAIKPTKVPNIKVIGWLLAAIHGLFLGLITATGHKYDLVYVRAGLSSSACLISHIARVPYVTEVNGLIWDEVKIARAGCWQKITNYLLNWIENRAYRRSQHLIAVTPEIKRTLVTELAIETERITVIRNGVNTELFKPMNVIGTRRKLGLAQNQNYIFFVGGLGRQQGVEYLVESLPLILKQCPDTRLFIIGGGPGKQELIKLADQIGVSNKLVFMGVVPHQKVPLYINAGDVCVVPKLAARTGYSPLKLFEYMACGRPVVASRVSGLDVLEQCGAGLLANPEDSQELANAVITLLHSRELRRELGENGRKYVVENHSWKSVASRVAEVCQSLVDRRRQASEQ